MKWTDLIMGVALIAIAGVLALSVAANSEGPKSYSVVRQFEFQQTIRDVAFSSARDGDLEWLFPQVVVSRDSVSFFDERENRLAVCAFDHILLGCCGSHLGITTHERGPREKGESLSARFAVFTSGGQPVWGSDYEVPDDGPSPGFIVSAASGAAVELYAGLGEAIFRDPDGAELARVDLFEGDEWSSGRTATGSFSPTGGLVAIVAERETPQVWRAQEPVRAGRLDGRIDRAGRLEMVQVAEPEAPSADAPSGLKETTTAASNLFLAVFDNSGNELWRHALDEPHTGGHAVFSADEKYVAVDAVGVPLPGQYADGIYLFDRQGSLVRKFANLGALHVRWDPQFGFSQNNRVLGICVNRRIKLVNVLNGEIIWEKDFPWQVNTKEHRSVRYFHKMDLSRDGHLLVVVLKEENRRSRSWISESATVQVLEKGGGVLWEKDFPEEQVVAVEMTGNGEMLGVATSGRVEILRRDSE